MMKIRNVIKKLTGQNQETVTMPRMKRIVIEPNIADDVDDRGHVVYKTKIRYYPALPSAHGITLGEPFLRQFLTLFEFKFEQAGLRVSRDRADDLFVYITTTITGNDAVKVANELVNKTDCILSELAEQYNTFRLLAKIHEEVRK